MKLEGGEEVSVVVDVEYDIIMVVGEENDEVLFCELLVKD